MRIVRLALALVLLCMASLAVAAESSFLFTLETETITSAGVFAPDGHMVRTLWSLKAFPAGPRQETWDGLDDLGHDVPPGPYEARIALGRAHYKSVGTIGNSGVGRPMQAGTDDLVIDRKTDEIYTANNWEEAGQDFRKMDAEGRHLMDAQFGVRNGQPNGWPIAVAIDEGILYCSVFTVGEKVPGCEKTCNGGAVIRKFTSSKGEPLKFPTPTGYVRVRMPDPNDAKPFEHQSLHSMAICGDAIVAADRHTNRVYRFDKKTGQPLGEFALPSPTCVVVDAAKRLWFSCEHGKIVVTDAAGKTLARPEVPAKEIVCIRLMGNDRLWVADQASGTLQVYRIDAIDRLTPLQSYGKKARPGELSPLAIAQFQSFDVLRDGGFVLAQTLGHGSIVTRFTAGKAVVWQQVGLEFCTNGTYDQKQPDLFVSSLMNAYRLEDTATGRWKFEGNLLGPSPMKPTQSGGTPRIVELGSRHYYYLLTGDQVKIYRFEGNALVASAMVGLSPQAWNVELLGEVPEKDRPTRFAWHDANGDGRVQPGEIVPAAGRTSISAFSCEVDGRGNLFLPDHQTGSVLFLPLAGFDDRGNPLYQWSQQKTSIPRDETLEGLRPMKVCPLPDGSAYVLQVADHSFYPPIGKDTGYGKDYGVCWMGGWMLSKYDNQARRLFTLKLPNHCTGLDWIPNVGRSKDLGFVAGCYSAMELYHYSPDGLLLGVLSPKHTTGWLDHNGSVSINRNPRDGVVDLFAEESLANRISWYRMEDQEIGSLVVALRKESVPGRKYSDQQQFQATLREAQESLKANRVAEAYAALRQALDEASPRERPFVQEQLGRVCLQRKEFAQVMDQVQAVVGTPTVAVARKAEFLFDISGRLEQEKQFDAARTAMQRLIDLPSPPEEQYVARAMLRIVGIFRAQGKLDEALQQFEKLQEAFKTAKHQNPSLQWEAAMQASEILRQQKKDRESIDQCERTLVIKGLDENHLATSHIRLGEYHWAIGHQAKAIEHFTAAQNYLQAEPGTRADAYIRAGDCQAASGKKDEARRLYEQARQVPRVSPEQQNAVQQKLDRLGK